MKLIFILVVTAFTICLSAGYLISQHNRLFPEYGTNFRYIGEVKHGLDRVTVVTSIPIPRYGDIKKKPLEFNCTIDLSRKEAKTYGSY